MDLALVRVCRSIVSCFLKENQEREFNGLLLRDALLIMFPDCSDIDDYCRSYIEKMGEDAQGPFVQLGILQSSLNCSGRTVMLYPNESTNIYETTPAQLQARQSLFGAIADVFTSAISVRPEVACIHLLLRPGHYDLLYPKA
jgi:hypothetical protein